MRRQTDRAIGPPATVELARRPASRRRRPRPPPRSLLLLLPLVVGLLGAPAPRPGRPRRRAGRRQGRQAQLKKDIAAQKAQGRQARRAPGEPRRGDHEHDRRSSTASTPTSPRSRSRSRRWKPRSRWSRPTTTRSSSQLADARRRARRHRGRRRRQARPSWPSARRSLAERVRSAYDTDRTSLLETFLSGGTFTDMLAEMSYYIDVGEQDKALANQIASDQETLAALHQTVDRHAHRRPTTCARRRPPRSAPSTRACDDLKAAKAAAQEAREADRRDARQPEARLRRSSPRNKAAATAAIAKAAAAQKQAPGQIDALIRKQVQPRQHPVAVQRHAALADGRRRHPELRLHRVLVGAAAGQLRPLPQRHRHRRPVRHAGQGVRRRDGRLHRLELRRRRRPGLDRDHRPQRGPPDLVRPHAAAHPAGSTPARRSTQGQVIGYEGNTGHSTGAAPPLGGRVQRATSSNPRLFLLDGASVR